MDKDLGKNTDYGDKYRESILYKNLSYSEKVKVFNTILQKDKLTNAYARMFADILGLSVGMFTVFLSAFVLTRDKGNKLEEITYARQISSSRYILSKFIAIVILVLSSCMLIATHATIQFSRLGSFYSYHIDYLAFYKYVIMWVLPTIMFSTAIGMLISLVFGNGLAAVPVQFLLFYLSVFPLSGDYSLFKFAIRFRVIGHYSDYMKWFNEIMINRGFYILLSCALIYLTMVVFEKKRCGWDDILTRFAKLNEV